MSASAMRRMVTLPPALSKSSMPFARHRSDETHLRQRRAPPILPRMSPARYLVRHQADLVRFLQQLVRLRTVNPPGENYGEMTALLADTLLSIGMQVRRVPIPRALQRKTQPDQLAYPRYNVIGFWGTGAKKTVHFNAHYDVVPVSGQWRHGNPFSGSVDRGWIYGRGTSDMKGAIASIVFALKALRATGTKPNFNLEVSFTADEETDSTLGTGWVAE